MARQFLAIRGLVVAGLSARSGLLTLRRSQQVVDARTAGSSKRNILDRSRFLISSGSPLIGAVCMFFERCRAVTMTSASTHPSIAAEPRSIRAAWRPARCR